MDFAMESGHKIREVIDEIERCKERLHDKQKSSVKGADPATIAKDQVEKWKAERKKDPDYNITAPGLGFEGSSWYQLKQSEEQKLKPLS